MLHNIVKTIVDNNKLLAIWFRCAVHGNFLTKPVIPLIPQPISAMVSPMVSQNTKKAPRKTSEPLISLVRQEGFEPPTHGLEVHPLNYAPIIRSFNPSNIKSSRYSQNPYFP